MGEILVEIVDCENVKILNCIFLKNASIKCLRASKCTLKVEECDFM